MTVPLFFANRPPEDEDEAPSLLALIEEAVEKHDGHAVAYYDGKAYPIRFEKPVPATYTAEEPHPCGHTRRVWGCGGCDPGAIEYVREDGDTEWQEAPEPRYRIENGWLVREVDYHTCGAGDEHGHEPGCGLLPELHLAALPGWPADPPTPYDGP